MGIRVKLTLLFTLLTALFAAEASATYDYPYPDPWVATTSVALIRTPKNAAAKSLSIRLKLNGVLADEAVPYRLYLKPKNVSSDLVILIPGLGTGVEDSTPNFMANNMFKAGHQVLIVPNDFTEDFANGASSSGVVGLPSADAADMRNLILHILSVAKKQQGLKYSSISLIGYSLGALQSAFVSYQDSLLPATDGKSAPNAKKLNLRKTILINSPVDLFHGIQVLDQIGALKDQISTEEKLSIGAVAAEIAVTEWDVASKNPNYYLVLNNYLPRPDVQFQYLVGANFLSSLEDIAPPGVTGFANYLEEMVLPSVSKQAGAPVTLEALAQQQSLTALKDFLANNQSVFIMHNEDDFLLQPADLVFINDVFSSRATLYPHGGHLGNLWYPQNQTDLNQLLH